MNMNIIKCGDSRKLLKELEDNSVQCVYLDPPFNSNRDYILTPDNKLGFKDKFNDEDEYCPDSGHRRGCRPRR